MQASMKAALVLDVMMPSVHWSSNMSISSSMRSQSLPRGGKV